MHSTIRRNLLCAAPAALLAGAAMASETGLEDSPIMTLFREWQAGYDAMCADNDDDASVDHEHTYITGSLTQLERQMLALPSQDARDLAAKILAVTHFGDFFIDMRRAYPIMDDLCDLTGAA